MFSSTLGSSCRPHPLQNGAITFETLSTCAKRPSTASLSLPLTKTCKNSSHAGRTSRSRWRRCLHSLNLILLLVAYVLHSLRKKK